MTVWPGDCQARQIRVEPKASYRLFQAWGSGFGAILVGEFCGSEDAVVKLLGKIAFQTRSWRLYDVLVYKGGSQLRKCKSLDGTQAEKGATVAFMARCIHTCAVAMWVIPQEQL